MPKDRSHVLGADLNCSKSGSLSHGYIASAPELRQPVVALSLGGLRKRIEIALLPDNVRVVLQPTAAPSANDHRRRAQAQLAR